MTSQLTQTAEWQTWSQMKKRCHSPAAEYAPRGIVVCDRWRESFVAFLEDMGPRPAPEYSLDRIDNDGNYEPGNCRWATRDQQHMNRRVTIWVTMDERTQTLRDWAVELGISYQAAWRRWERRGSLTGTRAHVRVKVRSDKR